MNMSQVGKTATVGPRCSRFLNYQFTLSGKWQRGGSQAAPPSAGDPPAAPRAFEKHLPWPDRCFQFGPWGLDTFPTSRREVSGSLDVVRTLSENLHTELPQPARACAEGGAEQIGLGFVCLDRSTDFVPFL